MMSLRPAKRLLVLGGGSAGVAAAYQAALAGFDADVVEQSDALGGLHRSWTMDGAVFDIGAFMFRDSHPLVHTFPGVDALFTRVTARFVRITPQGSYDRYPLSLACYARDQGLLRSGGDLADLAWWRLKPARPRTVPAFAASYMGMGMYRRSGLAQYIERLYGLRDQEVALEFAMQRLGDLRRFSLRALVRRLVRKSARLFGKPAPRAKQNALARHPDGFGVVYGAVANALRGAGVKIDTGIESERLRRRGSEFVLTTKTWERAYTNVISTIPVRATLRLLGLPQHGDYETMYLHSLFFRGILGPPGEIFFNFTPHGAWKRAVVFSRMYAASVAEDHFTVEVTSRSAAGTTAFADEFAEHATALGLVREPRLVGSLVTPDAYPVYRQGRSDGRSIDRRQIEEAGVWVAGRQGRFEYLRSSEAMKQAASVVQGSEA